MTKASLLKGLDQWFGPWLCRLLGATQGDVPSGAPDVRAGPVLIVRPGGIGDAVMLLPMVMALRARFAGLPIEVLCESRNRAVFAMALPDLRLLIYDAAPWRTLRRLRRARYTAVLDTEQFHHFSAVLARWTRAPVRVGFKLNARRNALYTHLVSYALEGAEDVQFGRLLAALCGHVPTLPPKAGLLTQTALPAAPPDCVPDGAFAVLHTGGSVRCKRWPSARYAALCDRLAAEFGWRTVLVGDRPDAPFAAAILATLPPDRRATALDATGRLTLAQTTDLCRRAVLFVGPDSGIAHLAAAAGARCVVLFGPSDPAKWGPGAAGRAVSHAVPCGPCAIFGYNKPCRSFACMTGIAIEDALRAVRAVVAD